MAERTLTSANSVLTLVIAGLYPVPQQIQGFATDRSFATQAVQRAEVMMGVDGKMSAGFTPNPVAQTITLQADSQSKDVFSIWDQAQVTAREVFFASGTLTIPATGETFVLTRGALVNLNPIPDGGKTLQPQTYAITWESVNRSLIS
jgi:hypothetical protein